MKSSRLPIGTIEKGKIKVKILLEADNLRCLLLGRVATFVEYLTK